MTILVDFPLQEAKALLLRLSPENPSMSAKQCLAVESARQRLSQAVAVETGSCGSEPNAITLEATAEALRGQRVRISTFSGSVKTGRLERLSGFRTVILSMEDGQYPVNLSLVRSIEAERVAA
jgi:hypothetical protein